jgi:DNA-binding CsgD family transcriptional regulator
MLLERDPRHQLVFKNLLCTALIQILLKCTQAEAEVAASLLAGLTPTRIAQERRVSLSTVRTQIRALLEVSGTRRVAELIVLLARSL